MHETIDVLIVDDDQNMRLTLSEILSKEGYQVRIASTGEEAVELCRTTIFRVILMDVRMPGIDGLEAFRQIRQHCQRSQIILMSAYSNPELESSALKQGVLAFLQKPLDIEAVLTLITRVTSTAVLYAGNVGDHEKSIQERLVELGFLATFVPDTGEILAKIEQINYDMLILDWDAVAIPQREGLVSAARQIRSDLGIVCAINSAGDDNAVHLPNVMAVLNKPVQLEALVTLLEQVKRQRLGVCPPGASRTS